MNFFIVLLAKLCLYVNLAFPKVGCNTAILQKFWLLQKGVGLSFRLTAGFPVGNVLAMHYNAMFRHSIKYCC